MDWINQFINGAGNSTINAAERIGSLSTSSVLALVWIVREIYIFRWKKMESAETLKRLEAWLEASKTEEHHTEALRKMADSVVMIAGSQNATSERVAHLFTLIEERIPRKSQ